jgi:hypothetical protein
VGATHAASTYADPGAVVFADDAGAERAQSAPTDHRGPWLWCARATEVRGGATGRRRGHRSRCRPFRTRGSESRSSPSSGPRRHGRWRTTGIDCRRSRSTVDSSCSRHECLCGGRRGPMMSAITWVVLAALAMLIWPHLRSTCEHRSMVPSERRGSRRARNRPRGRIGNGPSMTSWIDSPRDLTGVTSFASLSGLVVRGVVRTKARSSVRKRWAPASARAPRVSAVNRQRTPRGLGRDRGPRRP